MNEVIDERNEAINEILMYMMKYEVPVQEARDMLYMIVSKYEITSRSTELTELKENRNEELLRRFLIAKTVKGLTKRTIKLYQTTIPKTLRRIGKTVDDITPDDIRLYMAVRSRRDKVSNVTIGNEMRNIGSFFQWLEAEELIVKNPMLRVDTIKVHKKKKEAFTEEEIEKLRLAAEGEREQMMIEVLLSTGCRIMEFMQIRLDEIDGDRILVHGKGNKDRYVYLNAKAKIMLERYLNERNDSNPYLNPGGGPVRLIGGKKGLKKSRTKEWWKHPELIEPEKPMSQTTAACIFRKIAKKAGVEQANPHKFRRTCATLALHRGMPIEQVSKMLGHEQLDTTKIYLDLSEEDLAQAHKKYVV